MNTLKPFFFSIVALITFAGLFSCKKDDTPIDIREKYIGYYSVHEEINSYNIDTTVAHYHYETDTIIYIGNGNTDTTLNVLGREVWIDSNGYFSSYHYSLYMANDSISSHNMSGGLGAGIYIVFEGRKP